MRMYVGRGETNRRNAENKAMIKFYLILFYRDFNVTHNNILIKINFIGSINFQLDNSRYYVDVGIMRYMMHVLSREVGTDN